jgi:cyclase
MAIETASVGPELTCDGPSRGNVRLIARLDVKMDHVIKGVQFEGWRKLGDPSEYARRYYAAGADELLYIDVVASLYGRNHLAEIVRKAAEDILIPITVGGGVRSVQDVRTLLSSGADKIAINTAATLDPTLLTAIADSFGAQAIVLSIEAGRLPQGGWEALTDNGRNRTGRDVVAWAVEGAERGAGEILVTSVNHDGTGRGADIDLVRRISSEVDIPVIAAGGIGNARHVVEVLSQSQASAVAMAAALHRDKLTLLDVRAALKAAGIRVRTPEEEED